MRILLVVLTLLLVATQYRLWAGENSLREVVRLREQIQRQLDGNAALVERNQVLEQEIEDLRHGLDAVEERARHELGMIREDEQFYRVIRRPQS
ncbi:cell division protein FtsB [Ferrimonas balearica DSM 9799]|uniref:Cell division protein FtsB n=1 Tax=Ferrimonas balearica (strain DSM 9799 / CCM 4581 / KCTC 23876 / PAT) TaxID=550540 RepID=E1SSZ9_FERBD|nr:cell division protein FtsB [Ferrimonas balearica]ADN75055.1 cell division protein FtsB [Ferrimonas balearica DSM 9799]MBW3137950.1 cell division protein FtsB [Ferrimonas balearica]MBW3164484.1 cell division protein FtsB [Ferrimonas balearica]MBY5978718.1 cell division protein FtsB [Ferrimonas balearica]MBY6104956.1 cell division protein FtsB [Ferrimonas balearica]